MARRKTVLATNEVYHIYNRGVEKRPIFLYKRDYGRFLELTGYYRFVDCPIKFSSFNRLALEEKANILKKLIMSKRLVDIHAFCLMPNHIHFLLKQLEDKGISKFMAKISNGFSHYFNTRHERVGHLFQGNFGAVRIETDEQHIHVSRYIHLNPISSYLIEVHDLERYPYSSYPEYIKKENGFCDTTPVLAHFDNQKAYKKFVYDQADYARTLENIKHLALE